ncbi:MAG TPA: ComEC/Rec2 family competence protein [Pyrinomonadaceae bacterium]|jgi:competence protein ComEC|nr:ComEC/Rec2 family competence protein [Pyrinomonadaceae bacterium]
MAAVSHRPNFSVHPLVALAASFAAGVLLARLAQPTLAACLALAALATASAAFAVVKKKQTPAVWLVISAFACAGALLASAGERSENAVTRLRSLYERGTVAPGEPLELTGVLERAPELAPDGLLLVLRVEAVRNKAEERACAGRVELFAPVRDAGAAREYDALELRRGARVRVLTLLARAERYRNPGVEPLGEFLERSDLDARGTIKSSLLVERLDDERVLLPLFWLDEWRAGLIRQLDRTFSRDTAGVLKAALVGNRYGLSRATAERFRDGGTFHILVINGLHIAFLGGLVWAAARRFTRRPFWQWAASAAFVWAYAVGVGASASVVRASLMFTAASLAPALARRSGPINAVGGAALALLVWRPSNLFDPSFQLTILSVGAIVAVVVPLLSALQAVGEWRPARATPYPPACPRWFRTLGEVLYWRERVWRRELEQATYSYRLFKTPWAARLERWRVQRLLRFAFTAVLVSTVVQLALLPLLVTYFHRLSLASPLMNIFVGALLVLLAFAALAALALSNFSVTLAAPLTRLAEATAALLIHSVDPLTRAHIASLRLPEYTGAASAVYVLYFLPLVVLACALLRWRPLSAPPRPKVDDDRPARGFDLSRAPGGQGRAREDDEGTARTLPDEARSLLDWIRNRRLLKLAGLAFAVIALVIVAHPLSAGRADGRLRVDFLDVGQGDSALVTMPDGATLLVDGGGRPDLRRRRDDEGDAEEFEPDARGIGDAVVSEYLWWRGLSRVDYVLATHADADHIDGLNAVVKNFEIGAAFVARAPTDDPEFVRFDSNAHAAGVPIYIVGRGDQFHFGAVKVDVLWPPPAPGDADLPSGNNDSVVLRLSYGRRTFLLTGDAEADAERALVSAGDELSCDALKVAHHGSRTSSTDAFVNAARPALAVVSVGQDSPYGHPHAEVLARWRASGAHVLTTGERGTVTVSTDGDDLKAETFVKP